MSAQVPSFFVYGEPDRPLDLGFIHVETVMERQSLHQGRVDAHKHDRMAQVTFWLRGRGYYFIEDQRLDFVAPAVSFVPSGVVHGFTVMPEQSEAIVASIADSALPPVCALTILPCDRPLMLRDRPGDPLWGRLAGTMERLLSDYRTGLADPLAALLTVALNDIALLARIADEAERPALALAFRRLVDQHFRESWPIARYITSLGTTSHLLGKACQSAYGLPIKRFIDERRLVEAKRLLLFTVRSVEDIAYEIGFQDPAYFSRFFRQHTGQPPGLWRAGRLAAEGRAR